MRIKHLASRFITGARGGWLFLRYLVIRRGEVDKIGKKTVFFDIEDPRLERYLYWLVKIFDRGGYRVAMRFRPWLLLNLRNCSDNIYDIRDLRFVLRRPRNAVLELTETPGVDGAIYLDTDYFGASRSARSVAPPFFMHPDVYHTELYEELPTLQDKMPRRIKVFLGGNLGDAYDTSLMRELFGLMNRSEVAKTVIDAFEDAPGYFEIKSSADAEAVLAGEIGANIVVMRRPLVALPKWMELLAASEFFVAPPGVIMPFSHNIIEAMAMGTIPITQYGHLFDPPLEHDETCLHFSDSNELVETVKAIATSSRKSDEMRQRVLDYYRDHLDPRSVANKIYSSRNEIDRLYLIAGHLSVKQLQARTSAAKTAPGECG